MRAVGLSIIVLSFKLLFYKEKIEFYSRSQKEKSARSGATEMQTFLRYLIQRL